MSGPIADADRRYTSRRGLIELWTGVLLAPLAWSLHLSISYYAAAVFCGSGGRVFLFASSAVFLGVACAGCWYARTNYRNTGREWPTGDHDGVLIRSRFLAVSGLLLAGLSALLIVAQTIPMFFLEPCR